MRRIQRVRTKRIVRPLKLPFSTALGSKTFIDNILVTVVLDDGTRGTGEVPTSLATPDETVNVIRGVLREAARDLFWTPIEVYPEKIEDFRARFPRARMTVSGLEVALFRACLAARGESEFAWWGGSERIMESDITVPLSTDSSSVRQWVGAAATAGFRIFKCKVSGNPLDDAQIVTLVHSILTQIPGNSRLRLDGNQGFTAESALQFSDMLEKRGVVVELFEQPLPKEDLQGLAHVKERMRIPIILDESVSSVESMRRAVNSGSCDGVNIKLAKSGISETIEMIKIARGEDLKLMIGCMMETMVGLSSAVYLACGTGGFDFVDLDSIYFLSHRTRYGDIRVEVPYFRIN